ncbi:MAG: hypothetical protein IPM35_36080 [Myxococcales bacterium]|nr:hypothetical protein [Myxococcales bacterium]
MRCLALVSAAGCVVALSGACGTDDTSGGSGGTKPDAAVGGSAGTGGGSSGAGGTYADALQDPAPAQSLRLELERVKPGTDFVAIVTALAGGTKTPGLSVSLQSSRGSVGAVTDQGDGTYRATISNDAMGTGEYAVTASAGSFGAPVTRTAVVMKQVGPRWGQPQAFAGMVNTPAWEDSLAISPDGEWIILQYITVSISCILGHFNEPSHPSCAKAIGPWQAPERPGMPGASRIAADGTIHHGCPALGLDPTPFAAPPMSMFGFRRQADGSFAEPFAISIDGVDGCVSAFGSSMLTPSGGKVPLVFAFDSPLDGDPPAGTQSDVFTTELTLGQPTALATFAAGKLTMNATLLGFPTAGQQGNPHYFVSGGTTEIWVDDETVPEKDLSVYQLTGAFPTGPWQGPTKLPSPFGDAGKEDIQPFADDTEALWTRDLSIVSSARSAGPVTSASSWGAVTPELVGEGATGANGTVIGVGEPTKAIRGGRQVLAFVYVRRAPSGDIDINAGFVEEQP